MVIAIWIAVAGCLIGINEMGLASDIEEASGCARYPSAACYKQSNIRSFGIDTTYRRIIHLSMRQAVT